MAFADLVEAVDRAVLEDLGGETVLYQPAVGPAVEVTGIFDEQYVLVKGDAEAGVGVVAPAVFFRASDLPADPEVDDPILTIGGVTYRMVGAPQTAGLGAVVLELKRIS